MEYMTLKGGFISENRRPTPPLTFLGAEPARSPLKPAPFIDETSLETDSRKIEETTAATKEAAQQAAQVDDETFQFQIPPYIRPEPGETAKAFLAEQEGFSNASKARQIARDQQKRGYYGM